MKKKEEIKINSNSVNFNPGLRSVAKLCLNSLWGKFGQRENRPKTEVVSEPKRLTELLCHPEIEVNGILPVNNDILYISWQWRDILAAPSPSTSILIAAFTTAQARLELHRYLNKLGTRVLYYDTDSVFYVSKPSEPDLPIGPMLGELTDEMAEYGPGTYITSFISGAPKF